MSQVTFVTEQQKFLSRLGNWFRRNQAADEQSVQPEETQLPSMEEIVQTSGEDPRPEEPNRDEPVGDGPRLALFRPWAKRDQAIDNLNRGLSALGDLLVAIRDSMDKQSRRQEELLSHLTDLPAALRSIPESNRVQGETLKAIQHQIERQSAQQHQLGAVLDRISVADAKQGRTLEALQQTVAAMGNHDQAICENLQTLGMALESVSHNSTTGAQVLEQLRDNTARRDGELERVIKRQNTRFTTMLSVAILLAIGALTAVSIFGYLAYEMLTRAR